MSKWYSFDTNKGYHQKRPPLYKLVLVRATVRQDLLEYTPFESMRDCIVVAYRKNAAGDKSCPYFVTPGCFQIDRVIAWRDCLDIPDNENLWNPELKWRTFN